MDVMTSTWIIHIEIELIYSTLQRYVLFPLESMNKYIGFGVLAMFVIANIQSIMLFPDDLTITLKMCWFHRINIDEALIEPA